MVPSPCFLWTLIHLPHLHFEVFNSVTCIIILPGKDDRQGGEVHSGWCHKIRAILRQTIVFSRLLVAGFLELTVQFFLLILMVKVTFFCSLQWMCPLSRRSLTSSEFVTSSSEMMIPLVTRGLQSVGEQEKWRHWDSPCQCPSLPFLWQNLEPGTRK